MGDLQAYLSTPCWVFISFWPKQHDPVSHPPYSPDLVLNDFFVSPDEKSPQREMFCQCRRSKTKNNGSKNMASKSRSKLFWAVKKYLDRCIVSNGESFEDDWSFFFLSIFQLFYCCSVTVVCIFFPLLCPTPDKPSSLPVTEVLTCKNTQFFINKFWGFCRGPTSCMYICIFYIYIVQK